MKKMICLMLVFVAIPALAQWRIVNGQYYRADDPRVWRTFPDLQVCSVFPDGSLEVCEVEQHVSTYLSQGIKNGTYGTDTASYRTCGQKFILRNYSSYVALAPGMDIGCVRAMLVPPVTVSTGARDVTTMNANYAGSSGNGSMSARMAESGEYDSVTYDVGTPYYPPAIHLTPAQIAAKKAVAESNIVLFVKSSATNGDLASECELGERYMKGDGIQQDKEAGKMWLEKAAIGGSFQASNDLQGFTLTNTVAASITTH
jgi:hypothetical protein